MFWQSYEINPSELGLLYENGVFIKILKSGKFSLFNPFKNSKIYKIPSSNIMLNITNQEILSGDNVAFRLSFFVDFKIDEPRVCFEKIGFDEFEDNLKERVATVSKIYIRDIIAKLESSEILSRNFELNASVLNEILGNLGTQILDIDIVDITFPKKIGELFAKELEVKLRAKIDLENARAVTAALRALKNAASMIKDDENLKFLQKLELLNRAIDRGSNTLNIDKL
ncbi:MAG: SPFH domain-containing protein [Campylobacter sp.]|nr:SPFH domain-containing protein [Campylobacter sp.]